MPYFRVALAQVKSNSQLERKAQGAKGHCLQTSQAKRILSPFFALLLPCLALPIAFVY